MRNPAVMAAEYVQPVPCVATPRNKWCGEFGDLSFDAKQVDGSIARKMSAFEQDRYTVFFCERAGRVFHCRRSWILWPSSLAASSRLGVMSVARRKQIFFVGINRVGLQKWVAARGSDDRIDN